MWAGKLLVLRENPERRRRLQGLQLVGRRAVARVADKAARETAARNFNRRLLTYI